MTENKRDQDRPEQPDSRSLERLGKWLDDKRAGDDPPKAPESGDKVLAPEDQTPKINDAADVSQLLMHSLLIGHFETPETREQRIEKTLNRFDELETSLPPRDVAPAGNRRFRRMTTRLFVSTAALLLVAIGIWYATAPQSADAAIQRAIESMEQRVTRVYDVKVNGVWFGRDRSRDCTLYTQSSDKFAVVVHDTIRKPSVIGSDGTQRWSVQGRRTWRSGDEQNMFVDSFIDRVTLRNLRVNSLITEIPDRYELKLLKSEPLPGDASVTCRPIEAIRIVDDVDYPREIRIWSHPQTGVVVRMEVVMERQIGSAETKIELTLTGEAEVPDEVFELGFHELKN